ncbi:MAG: TetR/AcrR family transcriptional regulator [Clostridia bacterium]|nr:TetR/AcrR family transcriptional regulator [Clostridia bacterium]
MKVRNLNKSSVKTRKLIKKTFIEMLSEKKEISKISVSELVERAELSRATFYAHFDDVYGVAEELEKEWADQFFTHTNLLATAEYDKFFDQLFEFLKENDDNYKMMCGSNEFLLSSNRLSMLVIEKLNELCNADRNIKDRQFIDLEISVFVEGLVCEYIKYCRGLNNMTPDVLHEFTKKWYVDFMKRRCNPHLQEA